MKIAIIGAAGSVGAPAAFYLASKGLADEVVLIGGSRQNVLQQHAMDLATALSSRDVQIYAGDFRDLPGCRVIINAAGAAQGQIADRMELLPKNLAIIAGLATQIREHCPEAIVITATNPVDPLNYATWRITGFDRRQIIGYSLNDSFRFRELIAANCHVPVSTVAGIVIGEHGSTQVPLFSSVRIDDRPVAISAEIKRAIHQAIPQILSRYEALQAGRTAGWTCAIGLEQIVAAITGESEAIFPCSTILDGEYGVRDTSMSVPVVLGPSGIERIVECELAEDEQAMLQRTVDTLQRANGTVRDFLQTR
ncbi:MAG: malate dehydrogenase [Desulfopila sp.]